MTQRKTFKSYLMWIAPPLFLLGVILGGNLPLAYAPVSFSYTYPEALVWHPSSVGYVYCMSGCNYTRFAVVYMDATYHLAVDIYDVSSTGVVLGLNATVTSSGTLDRTAFQPDQPNYANIDYYGFVGNYNATHIVAKVIGVIVPPAYQSGSNYLVAISMLINLQTVGSESEWSDANPGVIQWASSSGPKATQWAWSGRGSTGGYDHNKWCGMADVDAHNTYHYHKHHVVCWRDDVGSTTWSDWTAFSGYCTGSGCPTTNMSFDPEMIWISLDNLTATSFLGGAIGTFRDVAGGDTIIYSKAGFSWRYNYGVDTVRELDTSGYLYDLNLNENLLYYVPINWNPDNGLGSFYQPVPIEITGTSAAGDLRRTHITAPVMWHTSGGQDVESYALIELWWNHQRTEPAADEGTYATLGTTVAYYSAHYEMSEPAPLCGRVNQNQHFYYYDGDEIVQLVTYSGPTSIEYQTYDTGITNSYPMYVYNNAAIFVFSAGDPLSYTMYSTTEYVPPDPATVPPPDTVGGEPPDYNATSPEDLGMGAGTNYAINLLIPLMIIILPALFLALLAGSAGAFLGFLVGVVVAAVAGIIPPWGAALIGIGMLVLLLKGGRLSGGQSKEE